MSPFTSTMHAPTTIESFVSVTICGQLFGVPIHRVSDVFQMSSMTRAPLAPPAVAGIFNLRGRIVTAIDMRRRLNLPPFPSEQGLMAVGVEFRGNAYGLVVDEVGDVIRMSASALEPLPVHVSDQWASVALGLYRQERMLMVALDIDRVLGGAEQMDAASRVRGERRVSNA